MLSPALGDAPDASDLFDSTTSMHLTTHTDKPSEDIPDAMLYLQAQTEEPSTTGAMSEPTIRAIYSIIQRLVITVNVVYSEIPPILTTAS